MTRHLTFREVIDVLLRQGATVPCFRCGQPVTTGKDAEREHFLEKALGGDDSADNARISHVDCHAIVTRGNGATTAGSSVAKAAKDKRIAKGKMAVNKMPPGCRPLASPAQAMRSRKFPTQQRGFAPRGSRPMNKVRRA